MANELPRSPEHLPVRIEHAPSPESLDTSIEQQRPAEQTSAEQLQEPLPSASSMSAPVVVPDEPVDPLRKDIETVLEDGLQNIYLSLDEATQAEFRQKGEETAAAITVMFRKAKVHARKIVELITKWLRVIPGVSLLFIEQEAKIRTDRLLDVERNNRGEVAE